MPLSYLTNARQFHSMLVHPCLQGRQVDGVQMTDGMEFSKK